MRRFCINKWIDYEEIKGEHPYIHKFYRMDNPKHQPILEIPDGCVDLQWMVKSERVEIHLCGSYLEGRNSIISDCDRCFGIKFNPGIIPDIGHLEAVKLTEQRYMVEVNISGVQIGKSLRSGEGIKQLIQDAWRMIEGLQYKEISPVVHCLLKEVIRGYGVISMKELSNRMGYSQCYTDRIFKRDMGITLKKYAGIMRCQEAISYLQNNDQQSVYERLGYYDQSHFINDFKRFTSYTPYYYQKNSTELLIV